MATTNVNRPMGFRPLRYLGGAPWNGQSELYAFSASNSVAAYIYDICALDSGNGITALTDVYAPGIPYVACVSSDITTAVQRGVIVGFLPEPDFSQSVSASLGLKYRVASTARYGWVVDDVNVIFEGQEDGQSFTSVTANAVNEGIGTKYTAGNTTTGVSKATLKSSTAAHTGALPWRVYRYGQAVNNFGFVAADNPSNARFEVIMQDSDLFGMATNTNFGA